MMKVLRTILLIASAVWVVFAVLTGILPAKNFRFMCIISQATVAGLCFVTGVFLSYWINSDDDKENKHD